MTEHPVFPWLTEQRRGYFYRLALALGAAAVLVGQLSAGTVAAISEVVAAVLWVAGTGLAAKHTSVRPGPFD